MEMRYMTYKNEEGQKERFYPITHKDAIVGLSDVPEVSGNDLISTEAASEIVGDAPEIDPAIVDLVNNLTAEDVGALPSNGGYVRYEGNNNEAKIEARNVPESDANRRVLRVKTSIGRANIKDALLLDDVVDGTRTEYTIYGTHNKPTASDLSIPVNNNILINSNFANPVNQRGYVSGTAFMNSYFFDRWKGGAIVTITPNKYITTNVIPDTTSNVIIQSIEFPQTYTGKSLTLSVRCRTSNPMQFQLFMDGDANGSYASLGYPIFRHSEANKWEEFSYTFNISESQVFTRLVCGFNTSGSFDIEWMKLELGDHATPYVPRLFAEELELCKRYYQKYNRYSSRITGYRTPDVRYFYAPFRYSEMRVYPSVKSGTIYLNNMGDSDRIELTKSDHYALGNGFIQFSGYTNNLNKTDGTFDIYDIELDAEF